VQHNCSKTFSNPPRTHACYSTCTKRFEAWHAPPDTTQHCQTSVPFCEGVHGQHTWHSFPTYTCKPTCTPSHNHPGQHSCSSTSNPRNHCQTSATICCELQHWHLMQTAKMATQQAQPAPRSQYCTAATITRPGLQLPAVPLQGQRTASGPAAIGATQAVAWLDQR
jgi:hypothetical protein